MFVAPDGDQVIDDSEFDILKKRIAELLNFQHSAARDLNGRIAELSADVGAMRASLNSLVDVMKDYHELMYRLSNRTFFQRLFGIY